MSSALNHAELFTSAVSLSNEFAPNRKILLQLPQKPQEVTAGLLQGVNSSRPGCSFSCVLNMIVFIGAKKSLSYCTENTGQKAVSIPWSCRVFLSEWPRIHFSHLLAVPHKGDFSSQHKFSTAPFSRHTQHTAHRAADAAHRLYSANQAQQYLIITALPQDLHMPFKKRVLNGSLRHLPS